MAKMKPLTLPVPARKGGVADLAPLVAEAQAPHSLRTLQPQPHCPSLLRLSIRIISNRQPLPRSLWAPPRALSTSTNKSLPHLSITRLPLPTGNNSIISSIMDSNRAQRIHLCMAGI